MASQLELPSTRICSAGVEAPFQLEGGQRGAAPSGDISPWRNVDQLVLQWRKCVCLC